MGKITLTEEELNEFLTAMQEHREITNGYGLSFKFGDFTVLQMLNKDNDLFSFITKDSELVIFNITRDGKFVFDENFIFTFILNKIASK